MLLICSPNAGIVLDKPVNSFCNFGIADDIIVIKITKKITYSKIIIKLIEKIFFKKTKFLCFLQNLSNHKSTFSFKNSAQEKNKYAKIKVKKKSKAKSLNTYKNKINNQ
jgi:hypothetical protein